MDLPEGINPDQEYSQLMYIMDKKDWPMLNQHLHKPEVLQALVLYRDAMTQRKQAQNIVYDTYLRAGNEPKIDVTLMECISQNKTVEEEQLKILTTILYGKEIAYDELLKQGYLQYFFD